MSSAPSTLAADRRKPAAAGRTGKKSAEAADPPFVIAVSPLLREYTRKLKRLGRGAEALWAARGSTGPRFDADQVYHVSNLVRSFQYLQGPVRKLIAAGSAMLEEGRLTDLQRLELQLRQAEFEAQFLSTEQAVGLLKPFAKV